MLLGWELVRIRVGCCRSCWVGLVLGSTRILTGRWWIEDLLPVAGIWCVAFEALGLGCWSAFVISVGACDGDECG